MRWSVYTPALLAMGTDLVLGVHNHHIHHHQHGRMKSHIEVEPRDVGLIDLDLVTEDVVVETLTLTTTSTIFGKCIPTNTRYVTTTVFEDHTSSIAASKPAVSQQVPIYAFPEPSQMENVLQPATATIQAISSKPAASEELPLFAFPQPTSIEHSPQSTTPTAHLVASTHSAVEEAPQVEYSTTTPQASSNFGPLHPLSTHVDLSTAQTTPQEQTTVIHMTKTVTDTATNTPIVSESESLNPTSSANIATPSPSETSIEERPLVKTPSKTDQAPENPHLLGSLPSILPDNPTDILPHLPVPGLDQVLHPHDPPVPSNIEWTALPPHNKFSTKRFGGKSKSTGTRIQYHGNVGIPWGSNIIPVSPTEAHKYKYVAQFTGSNNEPWTVIVWNKFGPDGKMDGWYGHSAVTFILAPGETKYVAFDEDSVGAWGAAPGTNGGLPTDHWGGYTSTWGEFSFGDLENNGWSGWDVSAIQAQIAKQEVQGMKICKADGEACSILTPGAKKVVNAYTESKKHHDGIGGAAPPGPVRLAVHLDYKE